MGPGGIAFTVGGVVLVATCTALYVVIRINRARAKRVKKFEGSNNTVHSIPVSTARG